MLGRKTYFPIYFITIVIGIAIYWFFIAGKPIPQPKPVKPAPTPLVDIMEVKSGTQPLWINSQGIVEPRTRIQLVSQVSGRVASVDPQFASGGSFEANQALVKIEDVDYQIAISQAKAALADAQQRLAIEKGTAQQAKREWRDLKSQEANNLFLRKPQLASAEAGVEAAKASLQKARIDLGRTSVSVPFKGRVLQKFVDIGQFISAGTQVGEVFSTANAEVRLPLTTEQRYQLNDAIGAPVMLYVNVGGQQHNWPASIVRVESAVDTISRQHYAVVGIDDPFNAKINTEENNQSIDGQSDLASTSSSKKVNPPLSVGQFVQARISGIVVKDALLIPRKALRQPNSIWVLDENDRLQIFDVEVIQRDTESALVRLQLEQNKLEDLYRLVISDLTLALSGMQVQLNVVEE